MCVLSFECWLSFVVEALITTVIRHVLWLKSDNNCWGVVLIEHLNQFHCHADIIIHV
jgi:hypothetical protein